jgi:hypothetical protein
MKWTKQMATIAALTLLWGCEEGNPTDADKPSSTVVVPSTTNNTANFNPPAAPAAPPDVRSTNGASALPTDALAAQSQSQTNADDKK